jgi:hypothetical protein
MENLNYQMSEIDENSVLDSCSELSVQTVYDNSIIYELTAEENTTEQNLDVLVTDFSHLLESPVKQKEMWLTLIQKFILLLVF